MAADLMARIQRADPAPTPCPVSGADAIRTRILAMPSDPRVGATPARHAHRSRRRTLVLLGAAATLTAGFAVAATMLGPEGIFADNPAQVGGVGPDQLREAIPGTARQVATSDVPGLGTIQIWAADGTRGAVCLAARGPDGAWVQSGSPAGCWPRRTDPGESSVLIDTGFDYREADFFDQVGGRASGYRVWFGIVEPGGSARAVRIVDRISGVEARVVAGRFWAFTVPDSDGRAASIDPVAYDASGAAVADEAGVVRGATRSTP